MFGPLQGIKVIEFSGLGPGPLAGQLLADMGADVICVDRASTGGNPVDVNRRNKRSIAIDLKKTNGVATLKRLIAGADLLIEGFRPGVMEKLGLGPADVDEGIIYGRMTGWGQDGPIAHSAGHDINYLSLTGALHAIGTPDAPPVPPLNLVADFGGGAMFLVMGLLAALAERGRSGRGQVVDVAMIDGVPAMMGLIHTMIASGLWQERRRSNLLDGAAPFYRCYECADGRHISIGAIEPPFFARLVQLSGLPESEVARQNDVDQWPAIHAVFEAHFRTRTRDAWATVFAGSDACVAPVLTIEEAAVHPQNAARQVFVRHDGVLQAAPAPRFSRTPGRIDTSPAMPGEASVAILRESGFSEAEIDALLQDAVLS